ncbi:hypothetical protein [Haemophilus paraphrohaemolyticus]|uniref:hypothetical protein n=1 Tax=Haemophilus paraphrohaemolyticus TaxID=736 RepID=UPI003C7154C4
MKPLKALLALAVAMTATSSFAETTNPPPLNKRQKRRLTTNFLQRKKRLPKLKLQQQPI